jgi:hypothetical protein
MSGEFCDAGGRAETILLLGKQLFRASFRCLVLEPREHCAWIRGVCEE